MNMHLDWYDRSILSFVLESALPSATQNAELPMYFGIGARRIWQRFDAVVDTYASGAPPLDRPDRDLVLRAADYRAAVGRAHPRSIEARPR
jgi:hypothetical protein